ncbi:MAG: LemA family protein [Cyclobacteriaceae bacterium]|nr:LemA family protein [Cyclobacteriaceae bacterium]MCH8517173.1 LemA family protein [Cyclobacteriaceae bacterium]
MTALYIILGIVALLVIFAISTYNRLVSLRNRRENAFADIDVQLRQRHDLIPQLLNTVKGYMKHEEGVLTKITEARTRAMNAKTIDSQIEAEAELTSAMRGLNIQVEAYPDLKASSNFQHMQEEISDIENKLASVRRFFNSATKELNTAIEQFPAVLFAGMLGFSRQRMFDLGDDRQSMEKTPEINF